MALPSALTSPLSTKAVNDPELAAQANIDLNTQVVTNPGATYAADPTKGSLLLIGVNANLTLSLAAAAVQVGTMNPGQRVTFVITPTQVTPTITAGTGLHLTSAAAISLTQNRANVIECRYDGTELKQIAAITVLS